MHARRCHQCWKKPDLTAHRRRTTDQLPIAQPSPRSSRDLCWLVCDHICSILPTSASSSLLIGRDILRRAHCWRFWMACRQLQTTRKSVLIVSNAVNHETLLKRLQTELGVEGTPLTWLRSYRNAGLSMWKLVSTSQLLSSSLFCSGHLEPSAKNTYWQQLTRNI